MKLTTQFNLVLRLRIRGAFTFHGVMLHRAQASFHSKFCTKLHWEPHHFTAFSELLFVLFYFHYCGFLSTFFIYSFYHHSI
jgi:hypothetical protein